MSKKTVIINLWERLVGTSFAPQEFAKQILWHGGHDMAQLSSESILQLFDNTFVGDWNRVAFSFSAQLAYYSVPDKDRDGVRIKEEIVGWVFASFVMSEAVKQGAAEWEMNFNFLMNAFLEVRGELEIDKIVEIFGYVFSDNRVLKSPTG